MSVKRTVAILGATGNVGQRLLEQLEGHPWFEVVRLCASERSAGQAYTQACEWRLPTPLCEDYAALEVQTVDPVPGIDIAFSALGASVATDVEPAWAAQGTLVFSNARSYRMASDVPLVIPEVNPEHLDLLVSQRRARGFPTPGGIVTNANCSATFLTTALAPLQRAFGVETVMVSTLQAVSGAGYRGVSSMQILGNVIPHIGGEEEKLESETQKILGRLADDGVKPADITISAQVHRVPVMDGHTEAVSVKLRSDPGIEAVREALQSFKGEPQDLDLPSAPDHPIVMTTEPDRPQPLLDLQVEKAMATVVGRLRPCPVLDYKFVVLGHNTVRGAGGGSVLNAELMTARGLLEGSP